MRFVFPLQAGNWIPRPSQKVHTHMMKMFFVVLATCIFVFLEAKKDPVILDDPVSVAAPKGTTVKFTCTAENAEHLAFRVDDSPASGTGPVGKGFVEQSDEQLQGGTVLRTNLTVTVLPQHNNAEIFCKAYGSSGTNPAISETAILTVQDKAAPNDSSALMNGAIDNGTNVTCTEEEIDDNGTCINITETPNKDNGTNITCTEEEIDENGTCINITETPNKDNGTNVTCTEEEIDENGTCINITRNVTEMPDEGTDDKTSYYQYILLLGICLFVLRSCEVPLVGLALLWRNRLHRRKKQKEHLKSPVPLEGRQPHDNNTEEGETSFVIKGRGDPEPVHLDIDLKASDPTEDKGKPETNRNPAENQLLDNYHFPPRQELLPEEQKQGPVVSDITVDNRAIVPVVTDEPKSYSTKNLKHDREGHTDMYPTVVPSSTKEFQKPRIPSYVESVPCSERTKPENDDRPSPDQLIEPGIDDCKQNTGKVSYSSVAVFPSSEVPPSHRVPGPPSCTRISEQMNPKDVVNPGDDARADVFLEQAGVRSVD